MLMAGGHADGRTAGRGGALVPGRLRGALDRLGVESSALDTAAGGAKRPRVRRGRAGDAARHGGDLGLSPSRPVCRPMRRWPPTAPALRPLRLRPPTLTVTCSAD